ncbi:putative chitinase 2 [Lycorma delicatula]|uniref:putative chitinase 2 n=1 Tax=Lycorma delicatula TaxID=130591 RepID=UPI003F513DDD
MTRTDTGVIILAWIGISILFGVRCARMPMSGWQHNAVTVCYVAGWATYRPDQGKFTIDDLDPSLCSHLVYAFAGLNENTSTIVSLDTYNDLEEDGGKGSFKRMTSLKKTYPHLKVTLAIGGWNEGSEKYSALAQSATKRKTFIESVVKFLKKSGFDGLDLDWEYPGSRGGKPEDKMNFVSLVKELRTEMDKNGWILTAALGAGKNTIDIGYDLSALSKNLDYLHLMCYDYHGSWDAKVGANAPLKSNLKDDFLTVEYSVKYLLENGVSPKKLVVGLPFYGRTFILENPESNTNKTDTKGFQGPLTRADGFLGYNEICLELKENSSLWQQWWDEETKTAFARSSEKVIAFDNPRSLEEKVKFAASQKLAGVMIWSIDTDDFHGHCKDQVENSDSVTYPLLRSINQALSAFEAEKNEDTNDNKDINDNKINPNKGLKLEESLFVLIPILLSVTYFQQQL